MTRRPSKGNAIHAKQKLKINEALWDRANQPMKLRDAELFKLQLVAVSKHQSREPDNPTPPLPYYPTQPKSVPYFISHVKYPTLYLYTTNHTH